MTSNHNGFNKDFSDVKNSTSGNTTEMIPVYFFYTILHFKNKKGKKYIPTAGNNIIPPQKQVFNYK